MRKLLLAILLVCLVGCGGGGGGTSTPPPTVSDLGTWTGTWTFSNTASPSVQLDAGTGTAVVSVGTEGRDYTAVLTSSVTGKKTTISIPSHQYWWTLQFDDPLIHTIYPGPYKYSSASYHQGTGGPPHLKIVATNVSGQPYKFDGLKSP